MKSSTCTAYGTGKTVSSEFNNGDSARMYEANHCNRLSAFQTSACAGGKSNVLVVLVINRSARS